MPGAFCDTCALSFREIKAFGSITPLLVVEDEIRRKSAKNSRPVTYPQQKELLP
jgi:hypothetical protein